MNVGPRKKNVDDRQGRLLIIPAGHRHKMGVFRRVQNIFVVVGAPIRRAVGACDLGKAQLFRPRGLKSANTPTPGGILMKESHHCCAGLPRRTRVPRFIQRKGARAGLRPRPE